MLAIGSFIGLKPTGIILKGIIIDNVKYIKRSKKIFFRRDDNCQWFFLFESFFFAS
jgi:hypothetical protein